MIYFDNAATTINKPMSVIEAVNNSMNNYGNPSRGIYKGSIDALRCLTEARMEIADYYSINNPMNVAFTINATMALNIAISSIDGNIVATAADHNSVLRPVYNRGNYTMAPVDSLGRLGLKSVSDKITCDTRVLVMPHASNLTGNVFDIYGVAEICKEKGICLIVDAAQTSGLIPIDMSRLGTAAICFSGHKSFYGPQGTGGICISDDFKVKPLFVGGSGSDSYSQSQPSSMPDILEAGTPNVHGISGLLAGVKYVKGKNFVQDANKIAEYFVSNIIDLDEFVIYGDISSSLRVPIITLNHKEISSDEIAFKLWDNYSIAVRSGAHCAPLMHKSLGTSKSGAVRFSFSHLNTMSEVDIAIDALVEIINS